MLKAFGYEDDGRENHQSRLKKGRIVQSQQHHAGSGNDESEEDQRHYESQ